MRSKVIGLTAALGVLATVLATPAAGEVRGSRATAASEIVISVTTASLNASTFTSPWQVAWIPGGSTSGTIAFTDRGANHVGLLDPTNLRVQNIRLNNITSPGPIAVLDNTRFAVAGTGGVGILDRSGSGKVTELVMANTRNQVLALGENGNLLVADAQQNDIRIIRPPYGGPADITRFPLPQQCRNPTGLIPGASTIDVLCQQTNNIVRIDYTGNFGSSTPLPVANAGAQEARPSPTGFVFSGFNAGRFFSYSPPGANGFKSFALTGPAVPTVGLFFDPAADRKLAQAATALRAGKRPTRAFFFNSFTPSFRDGRVAFGSFPAATSKAFTRLASRNLVGSTNGPDGTIWVADATPGKPALHRLSFGDGTKTGRTRTGYRLSERLTRVVSGLPRAHVDAVLRTRPEGGAPRSHRRVGEPVEPRAHVYRQLRPEARGSRRAEARGHVPDQSPERRHRRLHACVPVFGDSARNQEARPHVHGWKRHPGELQGAMPIAETPPCECDSLEAELYPTASSNKAQARLGFKWSLGCVGGSGACRGTFTISGDKAARAAGVDVGLSEHSSGVKVTRSAEEIDVTCTGDCEREKTTGFAELTIRPPGGGALGRDVRSVTVVLERTCRRTLAPKIFRIVFGADGFVSDRRSDLNGNGIRDRDE